MLRLLRLDLILLSEAGQEKIVLVLLLRLLLLGLRRKGMLLRPIHGGADLRVADRASPFGRGFLLYLDRKGHLRLLGAHPGRHSHGWLVTAVIGRVLLGRLLLLVLHVLALGGLLNHAVQLLLGHADHGQLTHLRVSDHGALFQKLLLEPRKELLLCTSISIVQVDQHGHVGCLLLLLLLHLRLLLLMCCVLGRLGWQAPLLTIVHLSLHVTRLLLIDAVCLEAGSRRIVW